MVRTHRGSCHCKAVTYEVDVDLAAGTTRCNCTWCLKARNWGTRVAPGALRVLGGADQLADYTTGPHSHHRFCRVCGVHVYYHGHIPEIGGDYVTVLVATLDDASPAQLLEGPMRFVDGRADNWWNAPGETRHL